MVLDDRILSSSETGIGFKSRTVPAAVIVYVSLYSATVCDTNGKANEIRHKSEDRPLEIKSITGGCV